MDILGNRSKTEGDTFYLYKGYSFGNSEEGYELLLMAKHFPRDKEIRIYSVNDIGTEAHTTGLLSSKNRIRKANSMRVEKILNTPFDWD